MSKKKNQNVLVIIPIFNEFDNLEHIIDDLSCCSYDKLFVDDGSTDGSGDYLKSRGAKVITLPFNLGIGGCMQTGYLYAWQNKYDIAVQYDGDGQHLAEHIDELVEKINEGYEYVIGSRFIESNNGFRSSRMRQLGIRVLSVFIRIISGAVIHDVTSGFRACNRTVINHFVDYYPTDYPEPEVFGALVKQGYNVTEIPVVMKERQGGKSTISFFKSIYYMIKVSLSILLLSRLYRKK